MDEEWEQKVWKDSWAPRVVELDEDCIGAGDKGRKRGSDKGGHKRRKLNEDGHVAWGEDTPVAGEIRNNFLWERNL